MSAKDVEGFFEKVGTTKSLQAKMKALQASLAKENQAKSAAGVAKIASAAGYKFTAQEFLKGARPKPPNAARPKCPRWPASPIAPTASTPTPAATIDPGREAMCIRDSSGACGARPARPVSVLRGMIASRELLFPHGT